MNWRDQYVQGSFRGVPFRTVDASQRGGRRGEWHEFPQADTPWFEHLGRKGREISISCWVAGDDYRAQRDALITALEAEGSGTLVYPFKGELLVSAPEYECSESAVEGGIADFTITFVETSGAPLTASAQVDTPARAQAQADAVTAQAPETFAAKFSIDKVSGFVSEAAVKLVEASAVAAQIAAVPHGGIGAALRTFDANVRFLPASARSLVRSSLKLGQSLVGLVAALTALPGDGRGKAVAARAMMRFGEGLAPVMGTTPQRLTEARNQQAIVMLVRSAAAAALVSALSEVDYDSYDDAVQTRNDAASAIDALAMEAADTQDDVSWRALIDLRTALVADLTARGASLARLYAFTPRTNEPALVIARRLYDQTADLGARADDLVSRNRIVHPGFVRSGQSLSVLQEQAA